MLLPPEPIGSSVPRPPELIEAVMRLGHDPLHVGPLYARTVDGMLAECTSCGARCAAFDKRRRRVPTTPQAARRRGVR